MMKRWIVVLFILMSVSVSNAVETAERISDREIIEGLTTLREGQKAMNQRFDDMSNSINKRFDDVNSSINHIRDLMTWGFGVIFVSISSLAGFVLWDRRSALAPAIKKSMELEERENAFENWQKNVNAALRKLAGVDVKVAEALRQYNLL